jgi:hypothetical protein
VPNLANELLDKQLITADTFTALLLTVVSSTKLAVPMGRAKGARSGRR